MRPAAVVAAWLALGAACGDAPMAGPSPHAGPGLRPEAGPRATATATDAMAADGAATDAPPARLDAGGRAAEPLARSAGALDFGPLRGDARGRVTLAFELPDDVPAFVLTADPAPRVERVELLAVRGPQGAVRFDAQGGSSLWPPRSRSTSPWFPLSALMPGAPAPGPAPGPYQVQLQLAGPGARVVSDVVFRRGEPQGVLGVTLWLVAGAGLDASEAAASEDLALALSELADVFAQADIALEPLELRDLPVDPALSRVSGDGVLAELAAAIPPAAVPALHYLLVDHIEIDGRAMRGRTTGLPLPPPHPRLSRRGVIAIALDMLPASPPRVGELLAHEAGHALGLAHTSELDGLRHDPLDDTPECPADRASQTTPGGAPFLTPEDCADLDGRNLMFPTPPGDAAPQRQLSADQVRMLRASPTLR